MSPGSAEILNQLAAFAREKTSDPFARVSDLAMLPGHAGLSYGFRLDYRAADGTRHEHLVIRLAPAGVRTAGPADVVRQARIMASLADTAVPVPPVRWFDNDPRWFERPFFIVEFVDGEKLGETQASGDEARRLATGVVEGLTALHSLDWRARREAWGEPFPLADELARLDHLLDRPTLDSAAVARAPALRELLKASLPTEPRIGCVHGDFQWSNCLLRDGRLVAAIDWELAQVGATLLDLGWLCLFSDPQSWANAMLVPANVPAPDDLVDLYASSVRFPVSVAEVRWFQAFSAYRFGVITVFNLMLHRRGKRPDPVWEEIGKSAPRLFDHGLELLEAVSS